MGAECSFGIVTHGGFLKHHPFELHRHQRLKRFLPHVCINPHILPLRLVQQFPNVGTTQRNQRSHRFADLLNVAVFENKFGISAEMARGDIHRQNIAAAIENSPALPAGFLFQMTPLFDSRQR